MQVNQHLLYWAKLVLLCSAAASFVMPCISYAGLFADLNSVVMSNATTPSVLKTTDRTGLYGGNLDVRVPVTSVNVITFDPPRFDAGCSGISLSGGGFSFISADQIVKTFKNIAANSQGLAFKAAIDAISPNLGHLMTDFQDLLQTMNNHFKNTCSIAKTMTAGSDKTLTNAISGEGAIGGLNTQFTDVSNSLDKFLVSASAYMNTTAPNNPNAGNTALKQMIASGALASLDGSGLTNSDGSSDDPTDPNGLNAKVLLSLIGFQMSAVNCTLADLNGHVQNASTSGLGSALSCNAAATLTLKNLIDGGGTGSTDPTTPLVIWQCMNPNGSLSGGADPQICTQMKQVQWNYPGFRGYVNTMLFGVPDAASINSGNLAPTSIIGSFSRASVSPAGPLSAVQIQFLNKMGLRPALLHKSADIGVRIDIGIKLGEYVSTCLAARVGQALWQSANKMKTGNNYTPAPDFKDYVDQLQIDYKREGEQCSQSRKVIDSLDLLTKRAQLQDNRR